MSVLEVSYIPTMNVILGAKSLICEPGVKGLLGGIV